MSKRLSVKDGVQEWITKINTVFDLQNVDGSFTNSQTSWDDTTFILSGGKIRAGTNILDVSGGYIVLPTASVSVVGVTVSTGALSSYLDNDIPESDFIPLYIVTTNNERVVSAEDVRTWALYSGGYTGSFLDGEGKTVYVEDGLITNVE